jgi:hypothetical protein
LSILVLSFYAPLPIFIGGGRVRCLGLSMKFGRYTAHRRIQHACGARQQDSSCPILSFGLPHSVPDAAPGPFQPGVGLPRRSRGSPGDLGTVEWGNAVHVHEPSGISVRIWAVVLQLCFSRTGREGRTDRTCGRVYLWGASRTRVGKSHDSKLETTWWRHLETAVPKLVQIRQNQVPATHCTSSSYLLRSSPQLLVQLRRRIAAIKARNPRLLRKQTQHH